MPTEADYRRNTYQYALEDYTTSTPEGDVRAVSYAPGYAIDLLTLRQKVESGQATPLERDSYAMQEQAARAIPMRDPSTLTYNAGDEAPDRLSGGSPDLAHLMLTLQDKMRSGQATPQESELFKTAYTMLADQHFRASVPQASDAFNPLGDQFFGALGTLALGATGGLAGGALAAGGGLASTLGSLGTLSGIAGTGAGVLGQATDQEWLSRLGLGLGAAGGIAGGVGGLSSLWTGGVNSLTDAARLASNAGRVVGGVGSIADNDALRQAGGWLGTAGQLGAGAANVGNLLSGQGGSVQGVLGLLRPLRQVAGRFLQPDGSPAPGQPMPAPQAPAMVPRAPAAPAGSAAQGARPGGMQALLQAAQQAQRQGMQGPVPQTMSPLDWLRMSGHWAQAGPQSLLSRL